MYCTESFGVFDISYISRTSAWNSPKTLHSIVPDIKNCRFNFDFNFSRGHLSDAIQTMLFQLRYLKDTVASFMMVTSLYLLNIKAMGYNKNYKITIFPSSYLKSKICIIYLYLCIKLDCLPVILVNTSFSMFIGIFK